MNSKVPWSMEGVPDGTRAAALAAARRSGQSLEEWLDDVIAERSILAARPHSDHAAEMKAIAAQLARLSDGGGAEHASARRDPSRSTSVRPDVRSAMGDAVAAIARRQADLDGIPAAPSSETHPASPRATPRPAASDDPLLPRAAGTRDAVALRRAGIDLSTEVTETFARFSRDLHEAIQVTDARPRVDALDRQVREIGRAVDGLPNAEALARIGEQTREMRDLLKASASRALPLDAVERQLSALEIRLGRLATLPVDAAAPPDFGSTMAEVRALLGGFNPGATMAALETRLDEITDRIERGLDAQGSAGLIAGLSRRVDEIHASLRSQLAETAVDTRPLEGLVRGLSDRLGQARAASADFEQLEIALRDVAAKVEAGGADPRGVQAIEAQFGSLAERLDRSEASLKALDGVEQALGELFSQFEVTRQVAIDAAETAARTAARDTLRAALQNPNLVPRGSEAAPLADQVARGLEDLRAMQDSAERRTQTSLADIRDTMERLAQGLGAAAPQSRVPDEPRRRRPGTEPVVPEAARAADPADLLIEPGLGRGHAAPGSRAEPRFASQPDAAAPPPSEADGPATFIAAARRAAQVAQASVASAAVLKDTDRRPTSRPSHPRRRSGPEGTAEAGGAGTVAQAKLFLARRRRPILLGIAALVLVVGALEIVKLGIAPLDAPRVVSSETVTPARTRTAGLDASAAVPTARPAAVPTARPAAVPTAVLPPVAAPSPPALPTFVAGPPKPQAPADGIAEGLRGLASAGDPAAQYEVGLRYAEGRGVARDPKQAVAWFDKAAAQGSAPAEYRLGSAYEKGVGADRDPALAIGWYAKSAEAGNIRAMHNLAVMSAEGAAGKPDYAKAAQWFGKASSYGVRDSQFNLAILYARGLGIEQSLVQSYKWFAVAASEGDDDAAKKRDEVAAKLDPTALAVAKAAAESYRAAAPLAAANEVVPPPGGWDAAGPRAPATAAKVSQL